MRLVWQSKASQENIQSNHRNRYFRPTRTITECTKNSIGAQTDQSEWNFHTAKNLQIRCSLLSALGLICDTFLATHINNVSGKRTRKASSERYRTWMFLVTDPMNVISRNSLGGMCFFAFDPQVFEFSSFRFFKFSNFHKCSPPSLPPSPTPKYSQKRSWNVIL